MRYRTVSGTRCHRRDVIGVDDRFWINIQTDYDLEVDRDLHADELAEVTTLVGAERRPAESPPRPQRERLGASSRRRPPFLVGVCHQLRPWSGT